MITDNTLGDLQFGHMNRLMHLAVSDFAADWVVCIDTDEFIQGPLVEHLQKNWIKEKEQCYRLHLVNYRAHPEDCPDVINPVERITHCEEDAVRPETFDASKVLFSRALVLRKGAVLQKGSHHFSISGIPVPAQWIDEVSLAHYPLRSPSQFANKIATRVLQKYILREANTNPNDILETPYREMRRSYTDFANRFYQSRASWVSSIKNEARLVKQPARYCGGPLRYTSTQGDVDNLIRNILDLAEGLASANSPGGTIEAKESPSPEISLSLWSPGNTDPVDVRDYPASSTIFGSLTFPLKGWPGGDRIHLRVKTGSGVFEIGEITVKYKEGNSHTFLPNELDSLLNVENKGMKLFNPAFIRILSGPNPFVVTLAGSPIFSRGTPTEVCLKARLFTDHQRIVVAAYSTPAIQRVNATFINTSGNTACYSLNESLFFGESGYGSLYLRTGWLKPQAWGAWSTGASSIISLRLNEPTRERLKLRLQLRRRKGIPVKLGIHIDQQCVKTLLLKNDSKQWVILDIPANPKGRSALDLSFQTDAPEGNADREKLGFGMMSLSLRSEEKKSTIRFLKPLRRIFKAAL